MTAQNTVLVWSLPSDIVSRIPNPNDKCNNINGLQQDVPVNTKRNSTSGDCICINEGTLNASIDPPTCTLACSARSLATDPEFKIEYDVGYPKIYANTQDTVGTPAAAKKLILSAGGVDGTIVDTGVWTPLFKTNGQPFYDPDILEGKPQLSLQRNGNTLKVLLYGHRTDTKIEHVRGKISIKGSPDIKWSSIGDISMDEGGKGVNSQSNDFAIITSDTKVVQFDLAVNE